MAHDSFRAALASRVNLTHPRREAIFKTRNGESGNRGIGESENRRIGESGNRGIGESGNRGIGESGNRGIGERGTGNL